MKILLTGGTGFLGTHLLARLEQEGHKVTCLRRGEYPHAFDPHDLIVNAAAELDRDDRMVESNLDLTLSLLRVAKRHGSRFIQIGSSSETGPVEGCRSEDTPCRPSNLYEATKLAATNLCLGYAGQYDLDICVARPTTLYGFGDKPRKLLPTLWRAYCDHAPVDLYPGGHDWLHVDDFADAILLLLTADRPRTKGQLYQFGTGISTSNAEIAQLFESAVSGSLTIRYHEERRNPYDVTHWAADASKAKRLLGWLPVTGLRAGIYDYVRTEWFREDRG